MAARRARPETTKRTSVALRHTSPVRRIPKWAQWQIDNPSSIYEDTERDRKANRAFWLAVVGEVRIWLAFAVICAVASIVLVVVLLIDAAI
jgi:hypothetical protein